MLEPATFRITLDKLGGAELFLEGLDDTVTLEPQQRLRILARVHVPVQDQGRKSAPFDFVITPLHAADTEPLENPRCLFARLNRGRFVRQPCYRRCVNRRR
ncbi:MAG: hypothetical protein R3F37_13890 [Candidatus Competibacteraceae bacterium]